MDLELSDEQTWLADAVGTLLSRTWPPGAAGAPAPPAFAALAGNGDAVALAMLEPGSRWGAADLRTTVEPAAAGAVLDGRKVAVEHAHAADLLAVVAAAPDGPALALVSTAAAGI